MPNPHSPSDATRRSKMKQSTTLILQSPKPSSASSSSSMALPLSRVSLFLFLLLALSSLFFLLAFKSTCPNSTPIPAHLSDLPLHHQHNSFPASPPFTLIIKLLTFNRLSSLSRCLKSLSNAHYDNSTSVHLHIFIDHFVQPSSQDPKSESYLDKSLNLSREVLDFVDGFKWDFGDKFVHYRTSNAGLQAQWLESWWPSSDHEFAFVVEDDIAVSPFYFRFLKGFILKYYYNQSNFSPLIYGASLQRPRFVSGKHGNKIKHDEQGPILLYQLVGTWGQLLFPRHWKEFRLWYDVHKAKGLKPYLDGMVSNGWYKRMGEKIWTPWFIKFVHAHGYFNLYTNLDNERAFSVSHRDAGVNYAKSVGPDSYLVDENTTDSKLFELPPLGSLKWYDFCFKEIIPYRVLKSSAELELFLHGIQKYHTVILVNLQKTSESEVRNLLCHFEALGIGNYILVGTKSALLLDLSRRGHPVIDVDQFSESITSCKPPNVQESSKGLAKEILVIAHVIKRLLELKFNALVMNSNLLLMSNNLNFDLPNHVYFYVGEKSEVIFIRSSSTSSKLPIDGFACKALSLGSSLRSQESLPMNEILVNSVQRLLEDNGVKYDKFDEAKLGVYVDTSDSNMTSPGDDKKFVFWSPQMDMGVLQKKLMQIGSWHLDNDLSCSAVVCHPS